jgi:hypothetical protein
MSSGGRFNPEMHEYYERKFTNSKSKLVSMVACMNKMVVQLNSIVKRGKMLF